MAKQDNTGSDVYFTGLYDPTGKPIYKAQGNAKGNADFFGPGTPQFPMAPTPQAGRAFDYPVGFNLRTRPRQEDGISFTDLRQLADHHDVTRLLIETRKDQMCALDWNIKITEEFVEEYGGEESSQYKEAMERAKATVKFFQYPDGVTPFSDWLRQLLEDLLVIDAPTVFVNETERNNTRFEVMDGATIKRLLDIRGRTPMPPDPAYQQIIKGLPAWDYTAEELIYYPRNPRPGYVYGCSPVQQIILTVNIALRKQLSQLQYYTEGNIPDALIGTPEEWTPSQIMEYQAAWDALHEGNTAQRRRAKFVPGNATIQQTREVILKDEFDEWLARVACYAFSVSPQAFVKEVNRATAETAKEAAEEEGLSPLMKWTKQVMDRCIQRHLGQFDLEFVFGERDDTDPKVKDEMLDRKVRTGRMTINEARAEDGLDPIEGGDVPMIFTASGAMPVKVLAAQTELPAPPTSFGEDGGEGDETGGKPFGGKPGSKPSGNDAEGKKPEGEEKPKAEPKEEEGKQKGVGGHHHTPFRRPRY